MAPASEESLIARWRELRREVEGHGARLIAVSKYAPDRAIEALAAAGQRDFAESRPQALRDRAQRFPGLTWHMIGPVQKNKAKYVGRHAAFWHSVEDVEIAREVARHVQGNSLKVLLQVKLAGLAQQHGIAPARLPALYEEVKGIGKLQVVGLMTMAPRQGDTRAVFSHLRRLRDGLGNGSLRELSMGMSGDYRLALSEGATMVRLGSILFATEATA